MKRIALFAMLAACTWSASAQEMSTQEEAQKKREINEIKWDENAVYADVIEYMADDSEKTITVAQQKSMQLLQAHVIEVFAKRLKMDKKDVQEIWDVIDDKCQNIEIRKGDLVRVFTYVMKDALGLSPSKPKEKDLKEYFGEVGTENAPAVAEAKVQEARDTVVAAKTEPVAVAVTTPSVEEKADTVSVKREEAVVVPQPEPNPINPQPAQAEVVVPELCKTMLAQKDMATLLKYLDTEKAYEKLIYGSERSMRRVADCYIVIVDKASKKIETVLDKGAAGRMNFITKQMDNFNNYRGGGKYSAIFVQQL